jgi:hypothetical protein
MPTENNATDGSTVPPPVLSANEDMCSSSEHEASVHAPKSETEAEATTSPLGHPAGDGTSSSPDEVSVHAPKLDQGAEAASSPQGRPASDETSSSPDEVSVRAPKLGAEAASSRQGHPASDETSSSPDEVSVRAPKDERNSTATTDAQGIPAGTETTNSPEAASSRAPTDATETAVQPAKNVRPQKARPEAAFLPQTPLLPGESPEDFARLQAAVYDAKKPADGLEEIFAEEVAQLTWESCRDSRLRAARLMGRAFEVLDGKYNFKDKIPARQYWMRDATAGSTIDTMLSESFGWTLTDLFAETLRSDIDNQERMLRVQINKMARRDASLREFDRHRLMGQALGEAKKLAAIAERGYERQPNAESPTGDIAPASDAVESKTVAEKTKAGEAKDGQ